MTHVARQRSRVVMAAIGLVGAVAVGCQPEVYYDGGAQDGVARLRHAHGDPTLVCPSATLKRGVLRLSAPITWYDPRHRNEDWSNQALVYLDPLTASALKLHMAEPWLPTEPGALSAASGDRRATLTGFSGTATIYVVYVSSGTRMLADGPVESIELP